MDTKKVILKLIKIAENQQKIINKLAQAQGLQPDAVPTSSVGFQAAPQTNPNPAQPAPQKMESAQAQKTPGQALLNALPPQLKKVVVRAEPHGNEMRVQFAQGQYTQANYDAVLKVMQNLTNQNVLQQAYQLKGS